MSEAMPIRKVDEDTVRATFALMVVKMARELGLDLDQTKGLIEVGWKCVSEGK